MLLLARYARSAAIMEVRQNNFWKFRNKIRGKSFSLNLKLMFWLFSELKVLRRWSCEFRKRSMPAIFTSLVYIKFTCLLSPFLCTFFAFKSFFLLLLAGKTDKIMIWHYCCTGWLHGIISSENFEFTNSKAEYRLHREIRYHFLLTDEKHPWA